ncbi:peroxiredoxin family protein, partial [Verrucomicrobia bacterium]|nr:peroxiredoxin family protein [Verrucomicrobiota bacterium]
QVLKLDPNHPMAYWGITMANSGNRSRSKPLIAKSVAGKSRVSDRERLWIDSTSTYLKESDSKKRKSARIKAFKTIAEKYPDDLEAQAFYTLALYGDVRAKKNYEDIEKRIAAILAKNPQHPCHHYRIHLWDYKDPKRALPSVGQCGQSASGIAHMWHMPSHILSRLKRYNDAAWYQEASARVDHAHMMRDRVMPDRIHNFAHNNEWLTRNLGHSGRVRHGLAMAKNMIDLPRLPSVKTNGTWTVSTRGSYTYGKRHLHGLLTNYELWDEILAMKNTRYLRAGKTAADKAKYWRLLASAYINTGKTAETEVLLSQMKKLLIEQQIAKTNAGTTAEAKAKAAKKKAKDVRREKTNAERPYNTAISTLTRGIAETEMYRALAKGDMVAAKTFLAKASDIRGDRKAILQFRMGDIETALKSASAAVKSGAEQARPLATQAYLLHTTKNPTEAKTAFEHLRRIAPQLDLDVQCFARLAPLAESVGLSADWRKPQTTAKDVGLRPNLDDLGPFRWQPSAAPTWSLTDRNQQKFSLDALRGKPVVLIFYLGKGCVHCMDQLNAFDPMAAEFEKQGITLLAISTDTSAGLRDTFIGYDAKDRHFNFPLLSDPTLKTFRKYRAYDDFENTPLHGTFLIDANGEVRWQEISHEPFMAPKFLLDESKRLLSQPAKN